MPPRPHARALAAVLVVILSASTTYVAPAAVRATGGDPIRYTYDAAGRLSGVVDPAAGSAKYGYDAAGNITSIARASASAVAVLEVAPDAAAVGGTVTIDGTGFSATPASNTVQFNGTNATVTSATTTHLVVSVPSGATTGTISVTSPSGSASSSTTFAVLPGGPAISGFSPAIGTVGSTLTVTGTGFETTPDLNAAAVNFLRANVTSASATSLSVAVPPASSGHVTVVTPTGSATTSGYLFVAPSPLAATDIVDTDSMTLGGSSVSVSITTAGKDALVAFDGTAGHRVALRFPSVSVSNTVRVLGPDGALVRAAQGASTGTFFDPFTLALTGTYTVHVDGASGSTGSLSVQAYDVPADATTSMTVGGSQVTVSTTVPGQNASVTFAGTTNQKVSWLFGTVSYTASTRILNPDGSVLRSTDNITDTNEFFQPLVLPQTGTYTLVVDGAAAQTGSLSVRAYDVPADATTSMTVGGSQVTVSTTVPGQNASVTFSGTSGQRVSWLFGTVNYTTSTRILNPDGSVLRATDNITNTNEFFDALVLPQTGTYTLVVDGAAAQTGSLSVRTYDASIVSGSITIGGSAVTTTLSSPGQDGNVTFSGTSGQAIQLVASSVSISQSDVSILKPDGSTLVSPTLVTTTGKTLTTTLTSTGTHTIVVNPRTTSTGSMTLTLSLQSGLLAPRLAVAPRAAIAPIRSLPSPDTGNALAAPRPVEVDQPAVPAAGDDDEDWRPDARNRRGDWRSGWPHTEWEFQLPLAAPPGETALAGTVLTLAGLPLRDVTLEIDGHTDTTNATGRFLLRDLEPGEHELVIDGSTAGGPRRTFGLFEAHVTIQAGYTNQLPYIIWMPRLDTEHAVSISNPTTSEVVLTTPRIPGLEVHIPAGSTILDEEGDPVTELGITPIPIDRTPFPLPAGVYVPVYFTVQPGGAYVEPEGAWVVYPNYTDLDPGTRADFWNYDPDEAGWHTYGKGTVTADGTQVVPDADTRIWAFTGAMFNGSGLLAAAWQAVSDLFDGDPVDLATGLGIQTKTDLVLPDTIPLAVTRSYRQGDTTTRPFGKGGNWNYGIFLWSANQYQEVDLILPDGSRVHYVRTSAGTGWTDAVFETTATPNAYFKSRIRWNGDGWDLRLRDGTTYVFADNAPLRAIRDRYGNTVAIRRQNDSPNGRVTQVTSPNGRWLTFGYDGSGRISSATDNTGRSVGYQYNAAGYLWKVTDPDAGITEYTYDGSNRLWKIKDARGITFLTNEYDANGRISRQTQADSTDYEFAYTLDGSGKVTATEVTNPRGYIRRVTFNSAGYVLTDTAAYGTALAQTTTTVRQASGNLPTRVTDELGRETTFDYDAAGNVTEITRLAGTGDAVTTTMAYEPAFNQLESVTDPLDHTTTYDYDAAGRLVTITDPRSKDTTFTYNAAGQPLTATDRTSKTTSFGYLLGDLVTTTDPGGNVTRRFVDGAGRVRVTVSPVGDRSRTDFDTLNRPTQVIDPLGGVTAFDHDANGNLLTLTDPRSHTTTFTYDDMDRVETREDQLAHESSFTYDENGNLLTATDREGQVAAFAYDALDRRTFAGFDATGSPATYESTIDYTFDDGNRLVTAVDSDAGTITRDYDDLDRLTSETTPQGTVSYAFDDAGRLTSQQLTGETAVTDDYDAADRLTTLTQGSASVGFTHDDAGRLLTQTLPNGIVQTNAYDTATRLSSISYALGGTAVGDLTYTYDASGHRTTVGGSLATVTLPAALTSATYDNANRLSAWDGTSYGYDLDGNLTSKGARTFEWNARGELSRIADSGTTAATFEYDVFGRRTGKTVGATATDFAYAGPNAVQELSGGSATADLLTGGVDQLFRRTDAAGDRYPLTDALGSVVALTNGSGAIATTYAYEPYGATTASGSASANSTQFTGRENDGSGLYFYRARYYDPLTGRFLSEDPAGFAAGDPNLYRYVGNSPTNASDPSGLFVDTVLDAGFVAYDIYNLATGSRKDFGANLLALGLDVLGLAIPFATGLGHIDDLARFGDDALSLGDNAIHYVDDLPSPARMCSFTGDTEVATPDGSQQISTLEVGDIVLAWDESSGAVVRRKVTAVQPHPDDEIAQLKLDNGSVATTPDHPFYTLDSGWVEAGRIRPGASVKTAGGTAAVVSVRSEPYMGTLWDLTVDGAHTFFVGEGKWLVHNCDLHAGWRGTNRPDHDSFWYHYDKHGGDVSPEQYAADARAWADAVDLSTGTATALADGETGLLFRDRGPRKTRGPGGVIDDIRRIITFWYH
jgi:RHS repeat-associated protein